MRERASRKTEQDGNILAAMNSRPEALVFDFDGVIANTEPLYWRAWCELLKPYEIPFSWDDYCRIGRGIRDEKMIASLAEIGVSPDMMEQIRQRLPERKELVRAWKLSEPTIAPATVRLLESLQDWKIGLVTSSDHADIGALLRHAGIADCFDACVFGEEITHHKPDPAPYLLIREKLRVRGGIAFEDSDAGLLSAAAAGFGSVRVPGPDDLPRLVREAIGAGTLQP